MPRRRVRVAGDRACENCQLNIPAARADSAFCSDVCELEHLRGQVQRLSRKKGPVKCLGRVNWKTCVQEWYLKESYDAKRRANELRKLGYGCWAQSVGSMPVEAGDGVPMVKVTLLTIWQTHEHQAPIPPPPEFIDGIRGNGRRPS